MNHSPSQPDSKLDVLIAEYLTQQEAGQTVDPEAFIEQYPDLRESFLNFVETSASLDGITKKVSLQVPEVSAIDTSQIEKADETIITSQSQDGKVAAFQIPENFGRYQIKKMLGQGAMGAVYHAFDTQLHREIALKIPKIADGDTEMLERFYREARTAGGIRNANICPVFDVGEIDGQHFISMAFIEGNPLSAFIRSGKKIPIKSVVLIIRKLAIALQEAHELGVVHRDLKPDNIMVDLKHEPVIMDFGLARIENPLNSLRMTQSGMILGTPAYMSPEQVEGHNDKIGPASDQYSMGVVLYEMTTGKLPFTGSAASVFGQIMTKDPTPPSELRPDMPVKLEQICLKMMSKNHEGRYADMQEVAVALAKFLKNPGPLASVKPQKTEQASNSLTMIDLGDVTSAATLIGAVPELREPTQTEPFNPMIDTLRPQKPGVNTKKKKARKEQPPPWWTNRLIQLGGLGGLALLLGIVFLVRIGKYDVQITLDDPTITVSVLGEGIQITDDKDVYKLSAGKHKLQLTKEGFETQVEEFTVKKDGKIAIKVAIVNGKLDALLNGEKPQIVKPPSSIAGTHTSQNDIPVLVNNSGETSLQFSDPDNEVTVPTLKDDSDALTIELWLQRESTHLEGHSLIAGFSGSTAIMTNAESALDFHTEGRIGVEDGPRDGWDIHGIGQPVHVAGVRDPEKNEIRLYYDGKLIQASQGEIRRSSGEFQLGSNKFQWDADGADHSFSGRIDEIRISKAVRYKEDFIPERRFDKDDQTEALYHFEEGTGDTLKDSSGNGHDGKITGAKWVKQGSDSNLTGSEDEAGERVTLKFDGNDEVVVESLPYDPTQPFTLEAAFSWYYKWPTTCSALFAGRDMKGGGRFDIYSNDHLMMGTGELRFEGETLPQKLERGHLALVHTGKELLSFRNGKLVGRLDTAGKDLGPQDGRFFMGRNLIGDYEMLRVSKTARYIEDFEPQTRFSPDEHTIALYNFDEGYGDILQDSSGNGYHGKIIGATWDRIDPEITSIPLLPEIVMPASTSNAYELEFKEHTYVDVPSLKLNREGPITVEAFVTWENSPNWTLFAGVDGGMGLRVQSKDHALVRWDADAQNYAMLTVLKPGKRLHLAGVYSGTKLLAFVDGKLVNTIENPKVQMSDAIFKIGENLEGRMGPVRVSSVARYSTDFTPSQQMQTDKETLALYKFNEGTGDVLRDSSGNGHDGKIVGATWLKLGNE